MQAMTALPAWHEWRRAALRETWVIPKFEYDWPDVKRLPAEARMKLVIGNKNYSSWSFRPWIAMTALGIPFEEILIPFGTPLGNPDFKARIAALYADRPCAGAGRWRCRMCGRRSRSWNISPRSVPTSSSGRPTPGACAGACDLQRDACGLLPLRSECPVNFRRPVRTRELSAAAQANVARFEAMWSGCRARHGGPFLFGKFCAADAMYAPVVARLHTYGIKVGPETLAYMKAMMALPAWDEWRSGGLEGKLDRSGGRGRLADGAHGVSFSNSSSHGS